MGGMYKDLLSRPKITVTVSEVVYFGNEKVLIDEVVKALQEVKRNQTKNYHRLWVDIEEHTDEWEHYRGATLIVKGERFMEDVEWISALKSAATRHKSEKERHEMHHNYYTKGMYDEDQDGLLNKILEIKKGKGGK